MNLSDSQGDESAYQEPAYYETIDSSLNDPESDFNTGDMEQRSPLREQDRFLPIANVSKIMKRAVPSNGKIAKDAKECMQECVSEFISFITSEAAERCQNEKRKTINGEDILFAMSALGFDSYIEPLKIFLMKFRDASKIDSAMLNESAMATVMISHPNTLIISPALLGASATGVATRSTTLATLNGMEMKPIMEEDLKPVSTNLNMTTVSGSPAILVPYSTQMTIVNGATVQTSNR